MLNHLLAGGQERGPIPAREEDEFGAQITVVNALAVAIC